MTRTPGTRAKRKKAPQAEPYAVLKERARARNAELSLSGRDIGELPAVADPLRKQAAAASFRAFCDSYFPHTFHLGWSPDHLRVMAKIEQAVLHGGLFAVAMPRGSGKTSLCECACLWAVLYGRRPFVLLIGSSAAHAADMLEGIKVELDVNDLLLADFPEVAYPIRSLEGIANRCSGQLHRGERTHIGWTNREIVLPTIAGSPASGAILKVTGITGRLRGMKYKRHDGQAVRPSLVVVDDPQTDKSAHSPLQCARRESILAGAVLGLAGPGEKMVGVMPCTVIRPGDMADNLLDRQKHPEWNGERMKMVYSFPTDEALWARYAELRAEGLRAERGLADATEFYRAHREAMDKGAEVAWPARWNPDELSAVQHAMNLKLQDEASFFAEYQNTPLAEQADDEQECTVEQIAGKLNRLARGAAPIGCEHVTLCVDVHEHVLYYAAAAWESDFTGYVIDYGTYPDQKRLVFSLRDARHTLAAATGVSTLEGSLYAGLERLTADLLAREWPREDGSMLRIERCLIDANWGLSTDVVYQFCRQSPHAGIVMPSHGRFVGAASQPFSDHKRKAGERIGHHWRLPCVKGKRAIRHVVVDANYWKSFVHARFRVPPGERGCLSLWGDKASRHRLFAEHQWAERCVRSTSQGRTVDEWKLRPGRSDNHWLDCLVGCAVGASMQGVALAGVAPPKRERRSFAAMQKARRLSH